MVGVLGDRVQEELQGRGEPGVEVLAHLGDAVADVKELAAVKIADRVVEGDQPTAFDQRALHAIHSGVSTTSGLVMAGLVPAIHVF